MARRTFSNAERIVYFPGQPVEYYDAARWWSGTIVTGPHTDPLTGWECVSVHVNTSMHSPYVETGDILDISPTKVRMPQ